MPQPAPRTSTPASVSVLVIGPVPPPRHGAAVVTAAMVGVFSARGTVEVIDTSVDGVEGWRYHLVRLMAHAGGCWRMVRRRRARPVVYVGGAGGAGLYYQAAVVAAARALGLKVIHHHHSYAYITKPSLAMCALVRIGGSGVLHVALSEQMRRALGQRYGAVNVIVCNNAYFVGPPKVVDRRRDFGAPLVLGHVGNLSFAKGLGDAVDTFREMFRRGRRMELRLAGPAYGEERRLIDSVTQEFGTRVTWVGALSGSQVRAFMGDLDVLLFPSRYVNEAQPLVVLEAASVGVPCVAIAHGGLASIMPDQGLLVEAAVSFPTRAAQILEDLEDPNRRRMAIERTSRAYDILYGESQGAVESLVRHVS